MMHCFCSMNIFENFFPSLNHFLSTKKYERRNQQKNKSECMVNFKKLLVSRQKKNNEQRKKKVFRLDLRDLIHFQVPQAEMDPIW